MTEIKITATKIQKLIFVFFIAFSTTVPTTALASHQGNEKSKILVTSLNDICPQLNQPSTPGTLRWAIETANQRPGSDSIFFDKSLSGTIQLDCCLPTIIEPLSINGRGKDKIIVDANRLRIRNPYNYDCTVFNFYSQTPDQNFELKGLTVKGGYRTRGVFLSETHHLNLQDCRITGHVVLPGIAMFGGAGLYIFGGDLTMTDSEVTHNWAGGFGGGLAHFGFPAGSAQRAGNVTITNSVFDANTAAFAGGAIEILTGGNIEIWNSSFTNNSSGMGGAISVFDSSLTIGNTTFSNNHADSYGGALYFSGHSSGSKNIFITNSTIANNSAPSGTSIKVGNMWWSGNIFKMLIRNSILFSSANSNCENNNPVGFADILGWNNIVNDLSCSFGNSMNFVNTDPQLGQLSASSSQTYFYPLQQNSPARDKGENSVCPLMDQRNILRTDGYCDIGAYEY